MRKEIFIRRIVLPVPAESAFAWHARPGALERLTPPWAGVRVLEKRSGIETGAGAVLSVPFGPMRFRWVAEHIACDPDRSFRDVQVRGPFKLWDHVHTISATGVRQCELEDRITYALPFGAVARAVAGGLIRRELERTFTFRHRLTRDDLALHASRSRRALRIAVMEADDFIGSALCPFLTTGGHEVIAIGSRSSGEARSAGSDIRDVGEWERDLDGVDAVIQLGGFAGGSSGTARASRIHARLAELRSLVDALFSLRKPPAVLVCVSDTAIFGSRGFERLTDDAPFGTGVDAEFRRTWEAAAGNARNAGVRVVLARLGVVLSAAGGFLPAMIPASRLGLVKAAESRRFVSWIGLDDALGALLYAVTGEELEGPVNIVAPGAVTRGELMRTLRNVLLQGPRLRSVRCRVTSILRSEPGLRRLRVSTRAVPSALLRVGYAFRNATLESALRQTLGADRSEMGSV